MVSPLRIVALSLLLAAPALGQQLPDQFTRQLGWQIALGREGFSPGIIDGKAGRKAAIATEAFQRFRGLPATGRLDEATAAALQIPTDVIQGYAITPEDAQKVTGIPTDWVARSKLAYTGYDNLAELVAERFQCSQALLATLNPSLSLTDLKPGDKVNVPAVQKGSARKAHHLEINFTEKIIRAFDEQGVVVGLFHCSIAANAEKRPSGSTTVTAIVPDPDYLFDPVHWPEVQGIDRRLVIHPGPRNPVGVCWIALGLPGYGIHGTPWPEMIGKTGSHGCFRMTNWDVARLGKMISPGAEVRFTT